MDYDWVVPVKVQDADFQQRPIGCRPDDHGQVFLHHDPPGRGANGMPDIDVGNAVLARWFPDTHTDNITCLGPRCKGMLSK